MKKAQKELDAVVGFDRVPEFNDKNQLPYINALVNETLRQVIQLILGTSNKQAVSDGVRWRS